MAVPSSRRGIGREGLAGSGGTTWTPPIYDAAFVARLVSGWTLDNPSAPLTSDPFASPPPADDPPDTVCAMLATGPAGSTPRGYRLDTFASEAAARAAGTSPLVHAY